MTFRSIVCSVTFLLLFRANLAQGQPAWTYSLTSVNHSIVLLASNPPTIDGQPVSIGDYLGVFFDSPGGLQCGGYQVWTGQNTVLSAWGAEPGQNNGFEPGETFQWKIWRASDGQVFSAIAVYLVSPFTPDGGYFTQNGLSGISTLAANSPLIPAPSWSVLPTGQWHDFVLPPGFEPMINNQALAIGDYLGAFRDSAGSMVCGGYTRWEGISDTIRVFGSDVSGESGFSTGDSVRWVYWRSADGFETQAQVSYSPLCQDSAYYFPFGISCLSAFEAFSGPDLSVQAWLSPADGCFDPVQPESIVVSVFNAGVDSVSGFWLRINAPPGFFADSLFFADTIAPHQTIQLGFSGVPDLSLPFAYPFLVHIDFQGDENPLNDTLYHEVVSMAHPDVSISGPLTSYCQNASELVQLTGMPPGGEFLGVGIIGNQFIPYSPGNHWLVYSLSDPATGCFGSDSLQVQVLPSPEINFPPDTSFCQGDTLFLWAGSELDSVVWSTGEQQPAFAVFQEGWYWVEVVNPFGCVASDTLWVDSEVPPLVWIGGDLEGCEGETLSLSANPGYVFYQWSTGEFSDHILVTTGGDYSLTITNGACSASASAEVIIHPPPHIEILGPDSACLGDKVTLKAFPSYPIYFWSNSSNIFSDSSLAQVTGQYFVAVVDENGCYGVDSLYLFFASFPEPSWTGIGDYCFGDTAWISPGNASGYLWENGATSQSLPVVSPGTYMVSMTDQGCTTVASAKIGFFSLPKIGFSPSIFLGQVLFQNESDIGFFQKWDFGDGNTSWEREPLHTYAKPGSYLVSLEISGFCGSVIYSDTVKILSVNNPGMINDAALIPDVNGQGLYLWVSSDFEMKSLLEIFDLEGRQIHSVEVFLVPGDSFQLIPIPSGAAGIFLFRLSGTGGKFCRLFPWY